MNLDTIIDGYGLSPIDSGRIGIERPSRGYFKDADFIHYRWVGDGAGLLVFAYDDPCDADDGRLFLIPLAQLGYACISDGRYSLAKDKAEMTGKAALKAMDAIHAVGYDLDKLPK